MCGIAGIINFNDTQVEPCHLQQSIGLLSKRGPDDEGIWIGNAIGLGHKRLSILDTSSNGHQPMESVDKRFTIVLNGEIYNFNQLRQQLTPIGQTWKSNSDTEVVIEAYRKWGVDCVKHFHGMFAFVIYDRLENLLFAARDRLGVKPFYYHFSNRCFAFASRPRAIFPLDSGISREIDQNALRLYLECGYIPAPYSIHDNIKKLLPGHTLIITPKKMKINQYWDFRSIEPDNSWEKRGEENLLEELDEIVSRCIRSRMISDVPLGAFLSGGIDSTLVVAMMAKYSTDPVKTFTIGFEEKKYDESLHAKTVADYLQTNHYCQEMKVNDLLDLIPTSSDEYDEPFFDSAAFPVLAVSRLARQHVTVSLTGDGGDELFGGYHYYRISALLHKFYYLPALMRKFVSLMIRQIPVHKYQLLSGCLAQPGRIDAYTFSRSISKDFSLPLTEDFLQNTADKSFRQLFRNTVKKFPSNLKPGDHGMRLDLSYTLPDDYLQKTDIGSMAYSLEARVPLLDQELVEWAMKLPVSFKLKGITNKYLLRQLAYRYTPKHILDRPKQGFIVPIDRWLRGPLKNWAEEKFQDKSHFQKIPLHQETVLQLWKMHHSGSRNLQPLLWAILMLLNFGEKHL